MNHHAREQRELQSQLRTISELLGECFFSFKVLRRKKNNSDFNLITKIIIHRQ